MQADLLDFNEKGLIVDPFLDKYGKMLRGLGTLRDKLKSQGKRLTPQVLKETPVKEGYEKKWSEFLDTLMDDYLALNHHANPPQGLESFAGDPNAADELLAF